ncbi:MAG TPA: hypothetical protein VGU25_17480 [Acidobacteriaceae bacterium]|nr:hypothetical protein [Acidobacteriaceae bacterium]
MRFLKFDIYEGGHVGFFNNLMSLELAIGLCVLSNRRLLLNTPLHSVFNSESGLTLLDLIDVAYPYQTGSFHEVESEYLPDLHAHQIGSGELQQLDRSAVISNCNSNTLGYYSYVLPSDPRVMFACNYLLTVKDAYRRTAAAIASYIRRTYGRFASVHIRRADFLRVHNRTAAVTPEELAQTICFHVPADCFLLIHSDEMDPAYFEPILACYPRNCLIDVALFREFFPAMDSAEIGIVSALIASESEIFLGTMFSTFTGFIHRKRLLNGKNQAFLYLYNQRPDGIDFRDGRILENGSSGPTWERIAMPADLRSNCFWWREWPESVFSPMDSCSMRA